MVTSIFGTYCTQFLNFIFQNPFIQANPIALMFAISVIPQVFLPVPKSEFMIPILTNGGDASGVLISATVGNVISEVLLYFLAKRGSKYLRRKEQKNDIEIRHFLHKYSFLFFIASPFLPFGTDALVLVAGVRKVKLQHIIIPMSIGFALKNGIAIIIVLQGVYFLPQFLKICT